MTTSPPAGGDTPANPWKMRLGILVLSHVVGTVNIVSVLTMAPVIRHEMDLSATQLGLFASAYYGAQAVGSIPAGALVDRHGVGWALVIAHAIMVAGALVLSQAASYPMALGALALMGIGYSITNPASARGVFEWFPPARRATAMGVKQVGVPIGGVIAAANGALVTVVSWQSIMAGIAGLILASGLLCLVLTRMPRSRTAGAQHNSLAGLGTLVRDWNINRLVLVNGLLNWGQISFFAYLTLFMREAVMTSQPVAGLCVGIAQATSALARIGWGVASDTVFRGRRKALTVGLGVASAVFLSLMALLGPGPWGVPLGVVLALALGATIASFAPLAQVLSVEAVEPRLAGSSMGYNMMGVHIGGMVGPPVFGAMVDLTGAYAGGWLVTAGVVLAGSAVLGLWFREGHHRPADTDQPRGGETP